MTVNKSHKFNAAIEIIGINPFVFIPENILQQVFQQAGKDKGPIPIKGNVNGKPYIQTLMKYSGYWRLYINMKMLKDSPQRIGEIIEVTVAFDPKKRTISQHPKLITALKNNKEAQLVFDSLSPSLRNEVVRYIAHLKTEDAVDRNVKKAIDFLLGKERFIGRDKP